MKYLMALIWLASFLENDRISRTRRATRCSNVFLKRFLYCHGVSMNALGKMFGVRASSVLKWIQRFATEHSAKPEPVGKAIVLEVDEMGHFLKKN